MHPETPQLSRPPSPGEDRRSARWTSRELVFLLTGLVIGAGLTALLWMGMQLIDQLALARDPPVVPVGVDDGTLIADPADRSPAPALTPPATDALPAPGRLAIHVDVVDGRLAITASGRVVGQPGDDRDAVLAALRKRVDAYARTRAAAGDTSPSVALDATSSVPNDVFLGVVEAVTRAGVADVTFLEGPAHDRE